MTKSSNIKQNALKNGFRKGRFCFEILIAQAKHSLYGENIQINCKNAQKTFDKFGEM